MSAKEFVPSDLKFVQSICDKGFLRGHVCLARIKGEDGSHKTVIVKSLRQSLAGWSECQRILFLQLTFELICSDVCPFLRRFSLGCFSQHAMMPILFSEKAYNSFSSNDIKTSTKYKNEADCLRGLGDSHLSLNRVTLASIAMEVIFASMLSSSNLRPLSLCPSHCDSVRPIGVTSWPIS